MRFVERRVVGSGRRMSAIKFGHDVRCRRWCLRVTFADRIPIEFPVIHVFAANTGWVGRGGESTPQLVETTG